MLEQRLEDGAGLLRRPQQRAVVDVERHLDAAPGRLAHRPGDGLPRVVGERGGDAGHEQHPRVEQRVPVERRRRDLPELGVEAVVDHLGRQWRIAGLHEIERHPPLAADAVRKIDADGAILVDEPLGEIALRDHRGESRSPSQLGQQAGHVGLRTGRRQAQLPAGGQTVASRNRQPDLRFSQGRQIIGCHWLLPSMAEAPPIPPGTRPSSTERGLTATPERWPAAARWRLPAGPWRRRSSGRR